MTSTAFLRFAPLGLIVGAAAASAQVVTIPPGGPANPYVAPGETGMPGGPSGTTATGSTMDNSNWERDRDARVMSRSGASRKDAARPATPAELTVGARIADNKGVEIGYIKSVDGDSVVVTTATGQVKVPAEALGKNKTGLLIGMSKADFDKLVAQAVGG
jgi:hypothetical protein